MNKLSEKQVSFSKSASESSESTFLKSELVQILATQQEWDISLIHNQDFHILILQNNSQKLTYLRGKQSYETASIQLGSYLASHYQPGRFVQHFCYNSAISCAQFCYFLEIVSIQLHNFPLLIQKGL